RKRFVIDRSAPDIDLRVAKPAWDNFERKMLFVFRASDRSVTRVHYRPLGGSAWAEQVHDRITRHGHFLLGMEALSPGSYEYYLSAVNEAGLSAQTALDTFVFQSEFLPLSGFDTLTYSIPMGHYLPGTYDFDGDNLEEVVMSEYDDNLGFGKLRIYEYNAVDFTAADSVDFKPILIPKDVQDTDGDGRLELLCSVNDSMFVVEQSGAQSYPSEQIWSDAGNTWFPARFADTDGDGELEILAKDFVDYKVLKGNGNTGWSLEATLADDSPDYIGSVAPRALVHDFDQDGRPETIFGDFDGDFLVYEANGNSYDQVFVDTTLLSKSGSYLTEGDFDGDGEMEFFVAAHTTLNRNEEDFEYEPPYWYLRMYEATGNNTYTVVWEDYLFDIDTENFNAATAGNVDQDAADELIFTTFPRTFLLEHDGSDYHFTWFHYGDLTTHHVIGDFNGNGVNEFAIGRGDKALFWEKDFSYTGPQPVVFLDGHVESASENHLNWQASPNATEYRIWRGEITGPGSILIGLIDSTTATTYVDNGLTANTD
ncbi:MAG: VCBS repeat-containing protein, partial [Bacteroidota bacterium]